jgi:hypothetical protein
MAPIVVAHAVTKGPVPPRATERFDPGVLVGRNRLRRELPANPICFLGEDDALTVSEGGKRGSDPAKAAAHDRDVAAQLAAGRRHEQKTAGKLEKVPSIRKGGHAAAS